MKELNVFENIVIQNNCKNGLCSNCGECCTDFIPLTKSEVKNIKAYIKKNNIKENIYITDERFDLRCPFFLKDNEHHCSIYPVRPQICRVFKCCQSKEVIDKNKNDLSIKADYNRFYKHTYHKTFVSLHHLFYNNIRYELDALYYMAKCNDDVFKSLLTDCLTKYTFDTESEVK